MVDFSQVGIGLEMHSPRLCGCLWMSAKTQTASTFPVCILLRELSPSWLQEGYCTVSKSQQGGGGRAKDTAFSLRKASFSLVRDSFPRHSHGYFTAQNYGSHLELQRMLRDWVACQYGKETGQPERPFSFLRLLLAPLPWHSLPLT